MKKYVKLLPLMIFPYTYIILLLSIIGLSNLFPNFLRYAPVSLGIEIISLAYIVLVIISTFGNAIATAKNNITAYEAAKRNLIVKAIQIPAYIFHCILFLTGMIMSVWGFGFMIIALVVNVLAIALTGIHAIGCVVKMRKSNVISKFTAVVSVILSFLYCFDIAVAIFLLIKSKVSSLLHQNQQNST